MTNLDHALKYSSFGWHVFPVWWVEHRTDRTDKTEHTGQDEQWVCQCNRSHKKEMNNRGKHPITKNGYLEATRDEKKIREWWGKYPKANIGIATGKISGFVGLDVDKRHDGPRYLAARFPELPITVEAISGSGSDHYLFKYGHGIKSSNGVLAPGIDIKSDGGYLIVEPSIHFSGNNYKWVIDQGPFDMEMAAAPDWMVTENKKIDYKEKEFYGEGERDMALISMAGKLRRLGLKPEEIKATLSNINSERCRPPLDKSQIEKIFKSCMTYKEKDSKHKEGKLALVVEAMKNDEKLKNLLQYNLFTKDIEYSIIPDFITLGEQGKILSDNDYIEIKYYLSKVHGLEVTINIIIEAAVLMSLQSTYHPIRDWIDNLKWDGNKRLETWLIDYCGAEDNQYTRAISRKVLCAAVARVYHPGHKFDFMMILEGAQGIGKSQLVEALGGHWYMDIDIKERNKDSVDKMRGGWIIEVSELVGFNKEDVQGIRAFVSRRVDRERLSYRRNTEEFPRQSVFIGTHNPSGDNTYFYDDTGNRRFWPAECQFADYEGIKSVRDQLFAEAKILFESGEKLYLDKDEEAYIALEIQQARLPDDPWERSISTFCKQKVKPTIDDIMDWLKIPIERRNHGHQIKVGRVMKKLGYVKRRANEEPRDYYYEKLEIEQKQEEPKGWEE